MLFPKPEYLKNSIRAAMSSVYRQDETECVGALLSKPLFSGKELENIKKTAHQLVTDIRKTRLGKGGLDAFLYQYDLSSQEGIALMCLAEALLRIPDKATADKLIRDKITSADWAMHLWKSHSLFVNAATWGLMLTGKILSPEELNASTLTSVFKRCIERLGEPVIRQSMMQAMRILGKQFVMGETIEDSLKRAEKHEAQGYRYSYDMLGEAARTMEDADRYFRAYQNAIEKIGAASHGQGVIAGPGISVKLSALHPRYEFLQRDLMLREVTPKLKQLALLAKKYAIGFTVDAEEADRLELSLDIIEVVYVDPALSGWEGFGLAIQAYQKRAPLLIDWIIALARKHGRKMMVRLVKGAYWDSEIKITQVQGLEGYPVFTRKISTDVSYLVCAQKLLSATDAVFPQFATHNAYSLAAILEMAKGERHFEFQCLHGMGDTLYDHIVPKDKLGIPARIYAPVGGHEDLLAYLVRRLLENGANTSFVNRIIDDRLPIDDIIIDPVEQLRALPTKPSSYIRLPHDMYGDYRKNSTGLDLSNRNQLATLIEDMQKAMEKTWEAKPSVKGANSSQAKPVLNPSNTQHVVGKVIEASAEQVEEALSEAHTAFPAWSEHSVLARAECLERCATLFEKHRAELMTLAIIEAGKTMADAVGEVREAIDFCYYYAAEARRKLAAPVLLPGPTGEENSLLLRGRGTVVCISPWNFPLAIFTGQVVAALVAGNTVIAKPAEQTPLIAALAVQLMHEAGVPREALHFLPGRGEVVGATLTGDVRVKGIIFTGSTETARIINQTLAARPGPLIPFVAETGGQNAMIVDSSACLEQTIVDIISSAFNSAGQRCSALRVLYVQEEIADRLIQLIQGAMAVLRIGNPEDSTTDIGPVIDEEACDRLQAHVTRMEREAKLIARCTLPLETEKGTFFAPCAYEIDSLKRLPQEVFGPVLHVIRYASQDLDSVIRDINAAQYGLTLGIHSRINETIQHIQEKIHVGNTYVNRNIIGAVVGVQPFGGEGLSGTGPKAGGPHYLMRLMTERTITVNTTAAGGNASLLSLDE